jgi:hypothetical protein
MANDGSVRIAALGFCISETRPAVTLTSSFSPDITWRVRLHYITSLNFNIRNATVWDIMR